MTGTTGTTGATATTRTFEKSIDNRKHLAERIAAISGQGIVYTRAPRYAYEIGVFSVERDGKLVVTINADNANAADGVDVADETVGRVIAVLKAEGSIGEEIITSTQASESAETAETAETAEAVNVADEAAVEKAASELPNQPAMETAEASAVIDSIMEAIMDETAEQPQGASEEASEEANVEEAEADETYTESINTPEISSIANMTKAATDNVINTAEIDSTDSTDSDTDSDNGMASDHCDENCLLGTEDWDDEADEEDSSDEAQIEQAEQQMPVIQLQEFSGLPELVELPAEGTEDASENDSMIDYG